MEVDTQNFVSTTGGATWQAIGSNWEYGELATYQGMSFALGVDLSSSSRSQRLTASDNLLSWHDIDTDIVGYGDTVDSFWLNSADGDLLVSTANNTPGPASPVTNLWDSRDDGQQWTRLTVPSLTSEPLTNLQVVVQQQAAEQSWHICVSQQINADPPHSYNLMACSNDGGLSWTQRSALNVTTNQTIFRKSDGQLIHYTPVSQLYLIAFESDGSLIAAVDDASTSTTSIPAGIYRLSPGGSAWQRIGRAPRPFTSYQSTFIPFVSGAIWVGGECSNLVHTVWPCYSVNAGDGVYTAAYP